jgi:trimeric autotransporter adhesin
MKTLRRIAVDSGGNVYIDDEANERVRRITAEGLIHTIAGNGLFRLSGNGGPAASATVDYPLSATEDGAGNIYISEPLQNRIRRIAPDGTISLYAGTGNQGFTADGKLASTASLAYPGFLAVTPREQYLVFAEEYN